MTSPVVNRRRRITPVSAIFAYDTSAAQREAAFFRCGFSLKSYREDQALVFSSSRAVSTGAGTVRYFPATARPLGVSLQTSQSGFSGLENHGSAQPCSMQDLIVRASTCWPYSSKSGNLPPGWSRPRRSQPRWTIEGADLRGSRDALMVWNSSLDRRLNSILSATDRRSQASE